MTINMKTVFILLGAALISIVNAGSVVVLGFNSEAAPSAGKSFDRVLREQLSVTPHVKLADLAQTQQMNHYIKFEDDYTVSAEDIQTLKKYVSDSTYFVWGTLGEFRTSVKRKYFFKAQIQGELSFDLILYALSGQKSSYTGTIKGTVTEDHGYVVFTPIRKAVQISALERTELLEKVENETASKACNIISAAIVSDIAKNEKKTVNDQSPASPDTVSSKSSPEIPDTNAQVQTKDTVPQKTDSIPQDTASGSKNP